MEVFDVFASFSLLDSISGPLGNIRNGMGETEVAGDNLAGSMGGLTQSMLPMILAAGLFLAALAPCIGTAANFESAISGVGAVSGATATEMATLEQAALDLGASTAWSASEVASAEKALAMAGFEVVENVAALPGVLDLASAAQHDLGDTANIASNILSSFGMEASEMGNVADILTSTFTSSNTTLASLSSTMANAGPIAAAAGASLSEVAAMAGKLGDVGIDASVAGTGIKIMFQRLQAPAGEAAKALKNMGIETKDASGNMLPIFDILGDLEGAMEGMGSADKAAYLQKIFGAEAVGSVQSLMTQGISTIKDYADTLDQPGKAAEVAAKQLENFKGATTILGSGFEALQISIGKIFLPVLTGLIKGITVVVGWLNVMAGHPIGKFILGAAAALAMGVVALGLYSAAMWAAAIATGGLNLAILANPIVLVVAALVGGAMLIAAHWGNIAGFFIGIFDSIEAAYHRFMGIWEMDGIGAAFANLWSNIVDSFVNTFSGIGNYFKTLWNGISGYFASVANYFKEVWHRSIFGVQDLFSDMSDGFKDALGIIASLAIAMGVIFLGPIALIGAAVAGVVGAIVIYWDDISSFFSNLWNGICDGASAAFDLLADLFLNFTPLGLIIKHFDDIVSFISSIDLSECGRKLWTTFTNGLKSMISAPVGIVKSGLQAIRNMLPFSDAKTGPLSSLTLSGQRMMETIAGGVGNGAGSLIDSVSNALSAPAKLLESGIGALPSFDDIGAGFDAMGEFIFGPAPEPAIAGAAPAVEVSQNTSKPTSKTSNSKRSASKSGGITIQHLTLNLPNVSNADGFVRELQKLVERFDG